MKLTRAYLIGCYMHIIKHRQNKKRNGENKISNLGIDKQNYWIYNTCKGKRIKSLLSSCTTGNNKGILKHGYKRI